MTIIDDARLRVDNNLLDWMRTIRQHIHQNPEISFREEKTAAYIQDRLSELGIASQGGIGGTGIVATLGDGAASQKCVGLRADMDALPIQEKTKLAFASGQNGVMHACGHDGHVAMLLGAAALLQRLELNGQIKLFFQPAEETGKGAAKMIEDGILEGLQAVFAGHIDTHFKTGVITVDQGVICAYADPFFIHIHGRSGHAARPHEATDAIVAAAGLVTSLQTLVSREIDPNHSAVVTVGRLQAGYAHNVIAEEAFLEGTLRSTDGDTRVRTMAGIERIVRGIATVHGVEADVTFSGGLPAVVNSAVATDTARVAAFQVAGENGVISQGPPSLGGEDFSFFQQEVEGCMVRFGAAHPEGAGPAHSGTFNFDEQVLAVGAAWLAGVALDWLRET